MPGTPGERPLRLGLVSALEPELAHIWRAFAGSEVTRLGGREFRRAHWHGVEVVAALAGIGKVAAATTATLLAEHFGVDEMLLTGTAGGLASAVGVGDVVVARAFLQHDMDASPLFPRWEVPLYGRSRFATDGARFVLLERAARAALQQLARSRPAAADREFGLAAAPQVHAGLIASGDRFVATAAESAALRAALPEALAVEMEGAAMAQVCVDFALPFAAVRTVSDRADDAAHVDFTRFVEHVASPYSAAVVACYLALRAAQPVATAGMRAAAT